ncbi:MAG TPA: hypothetical protein PKA83_14020 [Pirellulaceae bacterium]|nr:hypothetical protein [Pirellulaceae bacterium]
MVKPSQQIAQRMARYQSLIEVIAEEPFFELIKVKERYEQEHPRFITRVVNQLAADGWLIKDKEMVGLYRWHREPQELMQTGWIKQKLCGLTVTSAPAGDRPRERLLEFGAAQLKSSELLAILIRSGRQGESAVQAGQRVAEVYKDKIERLPEASPSELKEISAAIANTAYCQIMAGIELGRRNHYTTIVTIYEKVLK